MSGDLGARGRATGDDDDTATLEQQQHAGWENTYQEHGRHVRHRAHVPITDGLIEDRGSLQRSEGRAAVRSEQRSRSEGIGDDDTATQEQRHAGWRNTYTEHVSHVRHRAHVPVTDVLIEGIGTLHRSEGRAAVWSERRSRSDEMGDGRRRRHSDATAATREMEEHVQRTCKPCSSPSSRPNH